MRWTRDERHRFMEVWGEEPSPQGWKRAREWLADWWGHDRALRRWSLVVVGGDATLATLALRAHARSNPGGHALWVPDAHWGCAPFVWTVGSEVTERWRERFQTTQPLAESLEAMRVEAMARLVAAGGSWNRSERRLFDASAERGRVCVLKPRGLLPAAPEPSNGTERSLALAWNAAVNATPVWRTNGASMVGGVAEEVWVLGENKARPGWKKEPFVRDFSLAVSAQMPISMACSQWWDAVERLVALAQKRSAEGGKEDEQR